VIPPAGETATYIAKPSSSKGFLAQYIGTGQQIPAQGQHDFAAQLYVGPKLQQKLAAIAPGIELTIDYGILTSIADPLFWLLDWYHKLTKNWGFAIILLTFTVRAAMYQLSEAQYRSMAKMKKYAPRIQELKARYGDDRERMNKALMELYKKEKINPVAGCLPMIIQIPVFFSLYKVLFISIEMRHAPFFGWIHDLSAPDPTNIFTLFGLVAWDPTALPMVGHFLHLGIWPLIMGVTMFLQMKLNPAPPDPTQKMMFDWMPLIFTFMLANFSAGLVIYWAWNNTLSVAQQSVIMHRHGAKIELWDNLKSLFGAKKSPGKT